MDAEAGALALRLVVFGGEALELASLRPWFERHGDERPRLVNMYGITETTVHVTYRPLTRGGPGGGARERDRACRSRTCRIYLLDAHGQAGAGRGGGGDVRGRRGGGARAI